MQELGRARIKSMNEKYSLRLSCHDPSLILPWVAFLLGKADITPHVQSTSLGLLRYWCFKERLSNTGIRWVTHFCTHAFNVLLSAIDQEGKEIYRCSAVWLVAKLDLCLWCWGRVWRKFPGTWSLKDKCVVCVYTYIYLFIYI